MKKMKQMLLITLVAVAIGACSNNKKNASNDLKQYVDSTNNVNQDYTEANWTAIDNGYQQRAERAEAELASMSESDKKELEASQKKYAELKAKYDSEMLKRNPVIDSKTTLRNALFGEGKVGNDMTFDFVTSQNMLAVYQSFVDAVDANKDSYSREDWDEIKLLYEALDNHKNKDEKNLKSGDNMKIAALKIKVSGIYTTHRPGSKARENAEAKN